MKQGNMQKNCLILMPFGSEVRQFGHSGMITNLIDSGWNIVVAAKIIDEDLKNQLDKRIRFIPLIQERLPKKYLRLQELLDLSYQIIESRKGKKKWRYVPEKKPNPSGKIKKSLFFLAAYLISRLPLIYNRLGVYEHHLEMNYVSPVWEKMLRDMQIDIVIVNVPRSDVLRNVLIAAKQIGIPSLLLYHTSKDITVNGRINYEFNAIGVWNEWMKSELSQKNQNLNPQHIYISGCAHFDCVGRSDILLPENDFRKLLGARHDTRLVLFPASAPWVVPDEARYVNLVARAIETGSLPKNIQIVVRTNPMDSSSYFENQYIKNDLIIVQKANWRWESKQNWAFQRYEDMVFYNSLLHYSTICIGIPSTVTIECAISHLPVVNIGFDLPGAKPLPGSIRAFWDSEFYRDIAESKFAELAVDPDDLLTKLRDHLIKSTFDVTQSQNLLSTILGVPPHQSEKKYIELINQTISTKD